MGWEGLMEMERRQLKERREGKLRRALGNPLPSETVEQLDRIGARDRRRAVQGLVAVAGRGDRTFYKHVDDLGRLDMNSRIAAEQLMVGWLKERVARRKHGASAPPVPDHLG